MIDMKPTLVLLSTFAIFVTSHAYIVDPGPVVRASKGAIWPKPKTQYSDESFLILLPTRFRFNATRVTCDVIDDAFERYTRIIAIMSNTARKNNKATGGNNTMLHRRRRLFRNDPLYAGNLESLEVTLNSPCDKYPYLGMNEAYKLDIRGTHGQLESDSVWGILRGLESFAQLLVYSSEGIALRVNQTTVVDEPRFSWRGLLVDTSRHFISVFNLLQIIEGMSMNKMNVFHWHIVDDHSFPYESITFPELSGQGAYHPKMVYTQADVANVIEFARLRGVRVMVEFDTPGHTRSWGNSHSELLTQCEGNYVGKLGPIDPTKPFVYDFLKQLFQEIANVFPDMYLHLGGDEVGFECWESNKNITNYMAIHNLTRFEELEEIFIQKIVDMVDALKKNSIVWQEVYVNGVRLPPKTVVHVWTGDRFRLLDQITLEGKRALLSSCWYLDHLSTGGDWKKFYMCDPHDFNGSDEQKNLVLGGEACMWSEVVDNSNILQRIFPRACAAAEKLWSEQSVRDIDNAAQRLEEQYCRMKHRGIPAQPPNGPGLCI